MSDYLLRQLLLLLAPIGLLWLSLIILSGALWLRRQRRFAICAACLVLFVTIIGSTGLPGVLLGTLERAYAGVKYDDLPTADAVVVLGGAVAPARYEVGGMHLTKAADRLLMAIQLVRLGKAPVLIVGGAAASLDGTVRVESDLTRQWLVDWQLSPTPIISLGQCHDTRDEAVKVRALAGAHTWRRILLVTSANHMKRAVAVFQKLGMEVVPAPCNFFTEISTASKMPEWTVPSFVGFEQLSIWLHEQIGWALYRKRGWV